MERSNLIKEPLLGNGNPSKGGIRTLPFIIANEAFEGVASYGLMPNMILYLMGQYGMEFSTGSNYIFFWTSATNFAPLIGAYLADSYVGRFWMIGLGSVLSLMGTSLLWLTTIIPGARPCDDSGSACTNPKIPQLALLASSFVLMSFGAGGIRSSSLAFGADQLVKGDNTLASAGILERFFNWYYVAASGSVVLALSFVVYIQDHFGWKIGFGIPMLLMFLSAISFFLASRLYVKRKGNASSLTSFALVLVASWRKRHLSLSPERTDRLHYYCRKGSRFVMPTDRLRFLNKGCIVENAVEELTPEGTAVDPWRLCNVEQVEELKAIIKVIPIWSTGIMLSVCMSQTFPTVQSGTMNRHLTSNFEVPAGSLGTFTIVVIMLWITVYDRIIMPLAIKITGKQAQLGVKTRIGLGLLSSALSMIICAIIEGVRRKRAIEEGFSDNPNGQVNMSAYWLFISQLFFGIAQSFVVVGHNEFFYSELPKSMASVATNLHGLCMSAANLVASLILSIVDSVTSKNGKESWVSSNINKAHFDYYYGLLAVLSFINLAFYVIFCKNHGTSRDQDAVSGYYEKEDADE